MKTKIKRLKKAVVINGLCVQRLEDLKKEFISKNKMSISYDSIIAKALMKLNYEDLVS